MQIAFIGLGQMGQPMAINLLHDHPGLLVHSASSRAYSALRDLGAEATDDLRRLAASDIVFLCLPDAPTILDLLFGDQGIAQWMRPGSTIIDTSTVDYRQAVDIATQLEARNIRFMDAPVSGMPSRAADGTLTIMCGASAALFAEMQPYLQSMATTILHMGQAGNGQLTKLINQLLYDINCAALAEVLPMAVKLGLDAEKVSAVVNNGTGRSHASSYFLPHILAGRFDSAYPLGHAYKDLASAAHLSADLGIPLPLLSAATAIYQTALLQGHGSDDKGAMIKVYERLLGVEFRAAPPAGIPASLQPH